jgi:hypothetical protein
MPRVGFEPTVPVFERVKTVYILGLASTVIDNKFSMLDLKFLQM